MTNNGTVGGTSSRDTATTSVEHVTTSLSYSSFSIGMSSTLGGHAVSPTLEELAVFGTLGGGSICCTLGAGSGLDVSSPEPLQVVIRDIPSHYHPFLDN